MKTYTIRTQFASASLGVCMTLALLLGAAVLAPSSVHAQNNVAIPFEAAAMYNAWNNNFLVQSGGLTYYNSELNSIGQNNAGGYGEALDINVAEDNWDATHTQAAQTLVNNLLTTFDNTQGANWSGDSYNDDLGWMVSAYIHGYWVTGNPTWLSIAETNWNTAYNRGWDTVLGGGIYENMSNKNDKLCLSNDPFVWTGVQIYEATGDNSYLTKAEAIYSWVRSNLFNSTNSNNAIGAPGQLVQGKQVNGTLEGGDNLYNNGSFLEAAAALYHVTGNSQYYNDAVLGINHVMSSEPILTGGSYNEGGGAQWAYWFIKGLHDFCNETNTWGTYYPYLLTQANYAWQNRSSSGLTWNQFDTPTNQTNPPTDAVEMSSGAAIWQLLTVPQQDVILNKTSGLAMDLIGGNETNNAPIQQWGTSPNNANQDWSVVQLPNGYYSIISGLTGMAVTISAASQSTGATTVDWPFALNNTSLEYTLINEGSGYYEFKNVNSGLVLEDKGSATGNGAVIDQNTQTNAANQLWSLSPVVSFGGNWQIKNVYSTLSLGVAGASTTNGAAIDQLAWQNIAGDLFTFTPTNCGFYQITNVNSKQDVNVAGVSCIEKASIVQWPFGNGLNDQWAPVQISNGVWMFFNLNSGMALDDPDGTSTGQLDQWPGNYNTNQQWNLISH